MTSTTTSREWSNRRFGALLAAILWMVGFELVPSVHVGLHDWFGHHHHGDVAQHDHASEHGDHAQSGHHHHGDGAHGHGDGASDSDPLEEIPAQPSQSQMTAPGHGEHSLAHRGIAAIDPPPAQPRVMDAPLRLSGYRLPAGRPPRSAEPTTIRSRGPPSAPTASDADRDRSSAPLTAA